jgi:hypothetical protein
MLNRYTNLSQQKADESQEESCMGGVNKNKGVEGLLSYSSAEIVEGFCTEIRKHNDKAGVASMSSELKGKTDNMTLTSSVLASNLDLSKTKTRGEHSQRMELSSDGSSTTSASTTSSEDFLDDSVVESFFLDMENYWKIQLAYARKDLFQLIVAISPLIVRGFQLAFENDELHNLLEIDGMRPFLKEAIDTEDKLKIAFAIIPAIGMLNLPGYHEEQHDWVDSILGNFLDFETYLKSWSDKIDDSERMSDAINLLRFCVAVEAVQEWETQYPDSVKKSLVSSSRTLFEQEINSCQRSTTSTIRDYYRVQ